MRDHLPQAKKVLLESGAPSILDSWCLDIWLGDFLWELVIRVQQFARCLCDWNMNANGLPNDLVTQFLMQCCSQQFVRYHYDMALLGACANTWMYLLAFVLSIPNQIWLPYLTWWTSAYGHELSDLLLLLHSGTCECVTYLSKDKGFDVRISRKYFGLMLVLWPITNKSLMWNTLIYSHNWSIYIKL